MNMWPVLIVYLAVFAFFLWLLKRFVELMDDVRYLANQARKVNSDEIPKTNPRVTVAIVAVALLMLAAAIAPSIVSSVLA